MLTMGVEEEFLLLHPDGAVAPIAPDLLRRTVDDRRIKQEFMAYQVETTSDVCRDLSELADQLTRLRERVAEVAEQLGVLLVPSGVPPFGDAGLTMLTDTARYRELAARFPAAAASGTCGCHVHVGVADRDLAVQIVGRLRPWLPTLLALTVNSPILGGQDTGWSSNRYRRQLQWPTFRPPEIWAGLHPRRVGATPGRRHRSSAATQPARGTVTSGVRGCAGRGRRAHPFGWRRPLV
jgi:carboxylate-amine ligase